MKFLDFRTGNDFRFDIEVERRLDTLLAFCENLCLCPIKALVPNGVFKSSLWLDYSNSDNNHFEVLVEPRPPLGERTLRDAIIDASKIKLVDMSFDTGITGSAYLKKLVYTIYFVQCKFENGNYLNIPVTICPTITFHPYLMSISMRAYDPFFDEDRTKRAFWFMKEIGAVSLIKASIALKGVTNDLP